MRAIVLASAVAAASAPGIAAADAPPLPDATALGPGWRSVGAQTLPEASRFLGEADSRVYVGPDGARVWVIVAAPTPTPSGRRVAWDAANEIMDDVRGPLLGWSQSGLSGGSLLPDACAQGRHEIGDDPVFGAALPYGLTLCQADDGRIALAVVTGTVLGYDGTRAADRVVELVLVGSAAAPAATPQQ